MTDHIVDDSKMVTLKEIEDAGEIDLGRYLEAVDEWFADRRLPTPTGLTPIRIMAYIERLEGEARENERKLREICLAHGPALIQIHALGQQLQTAREALEGHRALAAKICYAEPELSEYRRLMEQSQQALAALEVIPKQDSGSKAVPHE